MPTPDESAPIVPPSPPGEIGALRSSCPPEEERLSRRGSRADSTTVLDEEDGHETETMRQSLPTPEPDVPPSTARIEDPRQEGLGEEKGEHIEDTALHEQATAGASRTEDSPSPASSPDTTAEGWSAQSVAERPESRSEDEETGPRYLQYPPLERVGVRPYSTTSFLRPGAKFKGTQQSDRQVYDVQVEIKDVDLAKSYLCGYLRIQGLTDDHPTLTTFFHSEIIGPHHAFLTTNPTLHSTPKIDLQHWSRFPPFRTHYSKTLKAASAASNSSSPSSHLNSSFTLKNHLSQTHLFMRWKELFLVPDHRVKSISGASFEGFYYICFDQRVGSVSGIYFHARSEKFQQLELNWVRDGGCVGGVEFR